jgi:hypothetical protein
MALPHRHLIEVPFSEPLILAEANEVLGLRMDTPAPRRRRGEDSPDHRRDPDLAPERMEERAREIKKRALSVTVVPSFQAKETLARLFP